MFYIKKSFSFVFPIIFYILLSDSVYSSNNRNFVLYTDRMVSNEINLCGGDRFISISTNEDGLVNEFVGTGNDSKIIIDEGNVLNVEFNRLNNRNNTFILMRNFVNLKDLLEEGKIVLLNKDGYLSVSNNNLIVTFESDEEESK